MKTAYVVTSGCYSDYSIHGVFSSKARAQKYIDSANAARRKDCYPSCGSDAHIEEWVLDEESKAKVFRLYSIGLLVESGTVIEGPHVQTRFDVPQSRSYVSEKVPYVLGKDIARAESCKSATHAMKLAVEARQAHLRKKAEKGEA